MWTCLLLLCTQFAVGISRDWANCPTNCSCSHYNMGLSFLAMVCHGRTDSEHFSEEIDSMLSGMQEEIEELSIGFTPMEHIPGSICRTTELKSLYLASNRITQLPNDCFSNFTNLLTLWVRDSLIETVQDGVFDGLTSLKVLNMSWNRISSIGSSVCQLTSLAQLDLSHNRLTQLPDNCFTNLTNLEWFLASNNAIETLKDGVFDGLAKLRYLDISWNNIGHIGSTVCHLTSLSSLNLGHNRLTQLPSNCFANLTNLEKFYGNDNAIETLGDEVFDGLEKLQHLDLGSNRIGSVSLSVCRLATLIELYFYDNRLTRLPDNCFTNLKFLVRFSASRNAIETLQDGVFDGLVSLKQIFIDNNRISSIGSSICRLPLLTPLDLYLCNNRLTQLPDCLSSLTNLESLSVCFNKIETLQNGVFNGLTQLKYLDLSNNRISSIGLSVFSTSSQLKSLFHIDLSWNNLTSLEPWVYDRGLIGNSEKKVLINLNNNNIFKFTNNMGLHNMCEDKFAFVDLYLKNNNIKYQMDYLSGWQQRMDWQFRCFSAKKGQTNYAIVINTLICDCVDYQYYRYYRESEKQLGYISGICNLTDPVKRKTRSVEAYHTDLSLFVCEITETERCPAGCICVYRPANSTLHVYCSNTNLRILPLELPELPDNLTKYKLDFSNNPLLHRLEHRDYFVNTSILDVSNCGVDDIRDWEEIVKIPHLNLLGNKIKSLPSTLLPENIANGTLNIAQNPWDCSCDKKWMAQWLNDSKHRLTTEEVLCDSPTRLRGKNIIQISEKEFCIDPATYAIKRTLKISLSSVGGVAVVLLSVGVTVYRLRVKLFTRWKFHPFDRDECLGEHMDYDVFLCCSSVDEDPHGIRILELMESKGYRVCYHERDFTGGQLILDNICRSIQSSKRTVCLLSNNFLRSAYCMHEFERAYHHNIVVKRKKRLIVLMMLDNPKDFLADDDSDTAVLRQFLLQYTYIDYTTDDWLDRLLYALPLQGLLQRTEDPDPDVPLLQL